MDSETLAILETIREMIKTTNERISSLERVIDVLVETHLAQSDVLIKLQKEANDREEMSSLSRKWNIQ